MKHYVEILFILDRETKIYEVSKDEFRLVQDNLMAIEDSESSRHVSQTFREIRSREPVKLAGGDRQAEHDRGVLISLEFRG